MSCTNTYLQEWKLAALYCLSMGLLQFHFLVSLSAYNLFVFDRESYRGEKHSGITTVQGFKRACFVLSIYGPFVVSRVLRIFSNLIFISIKIYRARMLSVNTTLQERERKKVCPSGPDFKSFSQTRLTCCRGPLLGVSCNAGNGFPLEASSCIYMPWLTPWSACSLIAKSLPPSFSSVVPSFLPITMLLPNLSFHVFFLFPVLPPLLTSLPIFFLLFFLFSQYILTGRYSFLLLFVLFSVQPYESPRLTYFSIFTCSCLPYSCNFFLSLLIFSHCPVPYFDLPGFWYN